jgi:protein transport protein SEC31
LLAAGTSAQQLDASFSTTASLDIYSVNLGDPSMDLELCHSVSSELRLYGQFARATDTRCNVFILSFFLFRFHKLAWGGYGYGEDAQSGLIVGGCDAGHVIVYDPAKLLNKENGIVANLTAHSGAVRALDFNSFQVGSELEDVS